MITMRDDVLLCDLKNGDVYIYIYIDIQNYVCVYIYIYSSYRLNVLISFTVRKNT